MAKPEKCYICRRRWYAMDTRTVEAIVPINDGYGGIQETGRWVSRHYHPHCMLVTLNNPESYGHKQVDRAAHLRDQMKRAETMRQRQPDFWDRMVEQLSQVAE